MQLVYSTPGKPPGKFATLTQNIVSEGEVIILYKL
jgi:hypothetical protein